MTKEQTYRVAAVRSILSTRSHITGSLARPSPPNRDDRPSLPPAAPTAQPPFKRVLHERVLLVSVASSDAPRVDPDQRVKLAPVGAGITQVTLHFGFMEHPNVMEGLKLACLPRSWSARHRPGADHLLFVKGHGHSQRQGSWDGCMAGAALCCDAPQRQPAGRLFWRAHWTGRRDGPRSRDLTPRMRG